MFSSKSNNRQFHHSKATSLILILLIVVGAIVSYLEVHNTSPTSTTKTSRHQQTISQPKISGTNGSSNSSPKPSANNTIQHIFLIVMENQTESSIIGNPAAPYINSLADQYSLATDYSGVTHPSLPNYLALTSGSTDGITTDCNPPGAGCIVNVANIADELQAKGLSWKQYAESMPSPCYQLNYGSDFATKHVPFLYYSDIVNNSSRCDAHVVPYSNLASDLKSASTTPNYAFITPNLCNDMHNCSIATGDSWLSQNVPPILQSPAFASTPSLLIITWDEGNLSDNHIATVIAGSAAKTHYQSNLSFNHYSLLHTIEYLFGLPTLTANDQNAPLMTNFIKSGINLNP
jgi:hypothetical protein